MEPLNFPYYWYPQIPFSGYHDTNTYNINLQLLKSKFIELGNIQTPFLFHITVGAAAEEMNIISDNIVYQWQQLLPYHIQAALEKGHYVIHYIIAPNDSFNPKSKNYKDPYFARFSEFVNIDIIKLNHGHYINKARNYECYIFQTMMPTIDTLNSKKMQHLIKLGMDKHIDISIFKQTSYDVKYVSEFYSIIDNTINKIIHNNGSVTCFSFATFDRNSKYGNICNFAMFPELKNIFNNKNKNKCKIFEWMFSKSCYIVYDDENNSVCFINPLLVPDIDVDGKFLELDIGYKIILK